jgi:hypothetical protein
VQKRIIELLTPSHLESYLGLVEQYCEILASLPPEDTPIGCETRVPTFAEFLQSRHLTALADLVCLYGHREAPSDIPLVEQAIPRNSEAVI